MAVPASDERDWEFAERFGLPIRVVVRPADDPGAVTPERLPGRQAYIAPGVMVNSGQLRRPAECRGDGAHRGLVRGRGYWPAAGQLPHARLAHLAPALLGHARSRSSIARPTGSCRCPTRTCPWCCPRTYRSSPRRARTRSSSSRISSTPPVRPAVGRRRARPTRWTPSWIRRGTSCATPRRIGTKRLASIRSRCATGCRSTSTWAVPSTPSCTCSIPASSFGCCATSAWSTSASRSCACTTRAKCSARTASACPRAMATWSTPTSTWRARAPTPCAAG